jgi:tetratricopeptide (TPR) repeat protein
MARAYLDRARETLESVVQQQTIPESYALLGSTYGLLIGTAKIQMIAGMQLGPKSDEWMERAVAAGPANPRVLVLKGIAAFNAPAAFGGGLDRAEALLKKALDLYGADAPQPPLPAWGRADAHIWLGQVYAKTSRVDAARAEYQAALALAPRNDWIRRVLLPSLDKPR